MGLIHGVLSSRRDTRCIVSGDDVSTPTLAGVTSLIVPIAQAMTTICGSSKNLDYRNVPLFFLELSQNARSHTKLSTASTATSSPNPRVAYVDPSNKDSDWNRAAYAWDSDSREIVISAFLTIIVMGIHPT